MIKHRSMGKSAEREEPVTLIGMEQTERRSVRRRLVQSTLFPHKSTAEAESNGDLRCDDGNKEENDDGEDEDFCGSQGKKARKRKGKTPPKNGASKKMSKEESLRKSTPKKNATRNGSVAANQMMPESVSPPVPDLRLEAKLKAEEDLRMFVGKQIHPFFSAWKAGKRNQEAAVGENNTCWGQKRDKSDTVGPIHVYERFQDGDISVDWTNWTFCEETSTSQQCGQLVKINSIFEHSAKGFDLNELPTASHPDVSVIKGEEHEYDQFVTQSEDIAGASPEISTMQLEQGTRHLRTSEEAEGECEVAEVVLVSCHAGGAEESCNEQQSRLFQQSHDCCDQPQNSLWVDKYQPRSAMEVCGNTESVKLMNEWLCLWHERGFQPIKDSASCNRQKMEDTLDSCYASDSDAENVDFEERLKKVLLIIGPVGSGKSAAIHACAKEQGFKILESNASECRSGAVVRQKFGEALESYGLKRSLETSFNSSDEHPLMPTQVIPNGIAAEDLIEATPVLDRETQAHNDRANVKPLILFEDVDICFSEDRGFVSAIQQIVEKAKGPVILTTNDENHGLPDNLDRLEICFGMPSTKELLSHLSSVLAAENVKVHPGSIEQLIGYCHGDIRKTIMHLQFWFQSKRHGRARKVQNTGGHIPFDLDAGHMLLPRIIPWDFPSKLSQLVEHEIAKSLSAAEENSTSVEVFVEEVENEEMLNRLWRCDRVKDSIEGKKAAMLRRNFSFEDCNGFEDLLNIPCELRNASNRPLSFSRLNTRRKPNVVLSSDSEDEPLNDRQPFISSEHRDNGSVLEDKGPFPSCCLVMQKDKIPLTGTSIHSKAEIQEASCYRSEISNASPTDDACRSVDVSCVPESSFVPETWTDNGADLSPRALSCGHFDGIGEASTNEGNLQSPTSVDRCVDGLYKSSNCSGNTCEIIAESFHEMKVEDSFEEYARSSPRQYQVMDECSRIDFNRISKPVENLKFDKLENPAQEPWRKLRSSHADLKQYLDSEPIDAPQVLDLTYQISNVFSEADLCHSRSLKLGALEWVMDVSGDLNTFDLCDGPQQITSTVAQQSFCFYAKEIAATGSSPSFMAANVLNLELFGPTTYTIMGRGLTEDEARLGDTSSSERCLEMKPETNEDLLKSERISWLLGIIRSIVPPKSYLALKGDAFHEYSSSLGQISRSDTSHSSEAMEKSKRRRSRGARHYLSTGSLTLSPEDIAFLGQQSTYRKRPL